MHATTKPPAGHVTAETITDDEALILIDLNEYWCSQRNEPFAPWRQGTCDALVAYLRIFDEAKVREALDIGASRSCENIGFVIRTLQNWRERKAYAAQFTTIERAMYLREKARQGGSSTSEAKVAAARENGKLGGRPRKVEPAPAAPADIPMVIVAAEDDVLDWDTPYKPPSPVVRVVEADDDDLSEFDDDYKPSASTYRLRANTATAAPAGTMTAEQERMWIRLISAVKDRTDLVYRLTSERRGIDAASMDAWLATKMVAAMRDAG